MPSASQLSFAPTFIALTLACAPTAPPPSPSPSPRPASAPTFLFATAPGSDALGLHATAVECSWGSSGVSTGAPSPYWVIALIDLESGRGDTGLTLVDLELVDADGNALGRADREIDRRMIASDATAFTGEDTPFDGTLPTGRVRLRLRARMEDAFASRVGTPPAGYRLTLRSDAGATIRISGLVGAAWPTA